MSVCTVCGKTISEGSDVCGDECLIAWLRVSGASEGDIDRALKSKPGNGVWVRVAAIETESLQ